LLLLLLLIDSLHQFFCSRRRRRRGRRRLIDCCVCCCCCLFLFVISCFLLLLPRFGCCCCCCWSIRSTSCSAAGTLCFVKQMIFLCCFHNSVNKLFILNLKKAIVSGAVTLSQLDSQSLPNSTKLYQTLPNSTKLSQLDNWECRRLGVLRSLGDWELAIGSLLKRDTILSNKKTVPSASPLRAVHASMETGPRSTVTPYRSCFSFEQNERQ